MSRIATALSKRPIDSDQVVALFSEATNCNLEQSTKLMIEVVTAFNAIDSKLEKMSNQLDNTYRVTDTRLARYFNLHPEVLEGFNVTKNEEKDKWVITFKDSSENTVITEAYNMLTKKLLTAFGYKELKFSTISNAILKAYHWNEDKDLILESISDVSLIETAMSFNRRFSIPELKKILPSLKKTPTKELEQLLLTYGWSIIQYGSCRVKYFYRQDN